LHKYRIYFILLFACFIFEACKTAYRPSSIPATADAPSNFKKDTVVPIPYHSFSSDNDVDLLINKIGDAKVVMLGESTHGTHEFYQWRAAITKKLIAQKGFTLLTVEGDWVDSYKMDRLINGPRKDSSAFSESLKEYDRWPTSLWDNSETASLMGWLNDHNQDASLQNKVSFYGMDLYSFWEWTKTAEATGDTAIDHTVQDIKNAFAVYGDDAMKYHDAVMQSGANNSALTERLWNAVKIYSANHPHDKNIFLLRQEAVLARDGEKYFRTMSRERVGSWNLRDAHMAETIKNILDFHGNNSKIIIWTHNTHAGDTKYSTMSASGYASLSSILRNKYGKKNVFITGFGTNRGTVAAGVKWDSPITNQSMPAAKRTSWEGMLHAISNENKLVFSNEIENNPSLNRWLEFRSVGATYTGNDSYSQSIIPGRFDAFVFIDSTTALHIL
jgi:erythromycin esterase-like protein